jgi:hypothetical protein
VFGAEEKFESCAVKVTDDPVGDGEGPEEDSSICGPGTVPAVPHDPDPNRSMAPGSGA